MTPEEWAAPFSARCDHDEGYIMCEYCRETVHLISNTIQAAIAEEREACAKVAETHEVISGHFPYDTMVMREQIAAAIRARGTT